MWKLTIKQSRLEEGLTFPVTESVEYTSDSLETLNQIMLQLSNCGESHKTEYKIERVVEE